MKDQLTLKRQIKCARRPQGHTFSSVTYGVCSNCLLRVDPPDPKKNHPSKGT